MREIYGEDVRLKLVTPERSWFRRKAGIAAGERSFGFGLATSGLADDLISAVETRALWSRFGL